MKTLLIYLLEASVCLGVTWAFYRSCLARLTFFRRNRALLIVLTWISIVLPLGSVSWSSSTELSAINRLSYQQLSVWEEVVSDHVVSTIAVSWPSLLGWLYTSGVIFFMLLFLFQLLAVKKIIQQSERQQQNDYTLIYSDSSLSAASFFRYIFINREALTSQEQSYVIRHELVHVRQGHTWDLLFFRLVGILFWFNPFAYGLIGAVREVHEYLADQGATQTRSIGEYTELMLRLATRQTTIAPVHYLYSDKLKRRIIMLHQQKSSPMKKVIFVLAIPLSALMFMFFSVDHSSSLPDQLIGTWKGTDFNAQQLEGPAMSQAMINGGQELHQNGIFSINEDRTYEHRTKGVVNGQGTWAVEGDQVLVTKGDNGEVVRYQIVELDDHTLATTHENQGETPAGRIKVAITLTYEK